jgi:assimilatory nitrate reductase catalytic subunit
MTTDIIFTDRSSSPASKECETTCPYCGVGCGVTATVVDNKITTVKGNVTHPANLGRLCVKGSSLDETLGENERVLFPRVNGKNVSWDEATSTVAQHFKDVVAEHGPDSVAFYLSGQLLTEDYYVANKLMKGFIGTGNVDTNSRLCMASASSAHKRAFGEDVVPGCYEDLEQADVIFMVGSNAAYAHPVVYQRIVKAKEDNPALQVIVLDPRATATSKDADLHLPLKPGSDAYYYNGLLMYLADNALVDQKYIDLHCDGFDMALATARSQLTDMTAVAQACDLPLSLLLESYEHFARNKKVITMFSQGINQSSSGVDKGNAIINCHLASGKIGYEGAGPFSITGQPNAMGGREVGGLATQIAAHLHFESPSEIDTVKRFWQAPNMAQKQGLKAVDMFEAVDSGKIKAIWIMATNPVVSMPDAEFVKRALAKCPMTVISECYESAEHLACADVVFPATTWGEKHGMVTNSERCMSLQKAIIQAPGQARNDWEIITDVAHKLGFKDAFNYEHQVDIFREHAALSGFENGQQIISGQPSHSDNPHYLYRAFDISAYADMSKEAYEAFEPIQWPVNKQHPNGVKRMFTQGGFATPTGKAKFLPILAKLPKKTPKKDQLIMNTGRIRDQWHTMSRTGRVPKLMTHLDEPFIQINPEDAKRFNIEHEQLAQLSNLGEVYLGRVHVTEQQRVGDIFVPIHWNNSFSISAKASALVNPITDDLCGQPEFKHSPVNISPFNAVWSGYLLSTQSLNMPTDYWTKMQVDGGVKYLIADRQPLPENEDFLKVLCPTVNDWVVLKDDKKSVLRVAGFVNDVLTCYFTASTALDIKYSTRFVEQQLGQQHDPMSRFKLLSGLDSDGSNDVGAIICSCFQIGEKTIKEAINSGKCLSVESLGQLLKCGTNCGSCIPELKTLL